MATHLPPYESLNGIEMKTPVASIYAIGTYLPAEVRTNDWWPPHIVERWVSKRNGRSTNGLQFKGADKVPPGGALVLRELEELSGDPFNGVRERRVMPPGMVASDMEFEAAEQAIAKANLNKSDIDIVIGSTQLPDYLNVATAAEVHRRLGLSRNCLAFSVEAACNGFLVQLRVAEAMIATGRARHVLLYQSSGCQHVQRMEDPQSTQFGDAASAVVVGPARQGGIVGHADYCDGSYYRALVTGVPEKRWYSGEAPYVYSADHDSAKRMLLSLPEFGKQAIHAALNDAQCGQREISYVASHQGTGWLRRVTQEHAGLQHALGTDSFAYTASIAAANVPFTLALGEKEGLLRPGALVALFAGGSGVTYSAAIVRWGM